MPARASKCRDFTQIAKAVVDAATSKGQVIQDGNASGTNPADQYVWGLMNVNQLVLRDYEFEGGAPRGWDYVQQDANWDTTAVVDSTGAVKYRYTYDPYGNVAVLQSNGTTYIGNYSIISSQTTGLLYLYQGGLMSLGGNYLFGARNYDPALARWMEQDPSGYSSGTNLYQAFGSDPANRTDPSGEVALPAGGSGGVVSPPIEYAPTGGGGPIAGAPIEQEGFGGGPVAIASVETGGFGGRGSGVTPFAVAASGGGFGGAGSAPIASGPIGNRGGGGITPADDPLAPWNPPPFDPLAPWNPSPPIDPIPPWIPHLPDLGSCPFSLPWGLEPIGFPGGGGVVFYEFRFKDGDLGQVYFGGWGSTTGPIGTAPGPGGRYTGGGKYVGLGLRF